MLIPNEHLAPKIPSHHLFQRTQPVTTGFHTQGGQDEVGWKEYVYCKWRKEGEDRKARGVFEIALLYNLGQLPVYQ